MENINWFTRGVAVLSVMLLVMGVMLLVLPTAFAGTDTANHSVTIANPAVLDITADTAAFTLTMSDYVSGSTSDTTVVTYTLRSNNNTIADGGVVLTASLGSAFTGYDMKADVGAYSKTAGNVTVVENAAGFVTIGTTETNLAKKQVDAGTGKNIVGDLPITYQATATVDQDFGNQVQTLTLTLSDA
jgi:hypothetical protein